MDPQSLFSKKHPHTQHGNKNTAGELIIGCMNELEGEPFVFGLKNDETILVKSGNSKQRFMWIEQGAVDIGFISSADFALLKGGWRVIPDMCISSVSSNSSVLFFRSGLAELNQIAVQQGTSTSLLALKIIMKELYRIEPRFIEESGNTAALLKKYDSVLLTGNDAHYESQKSSSFLNISEEWFQLTGLPLVRGFWIANDKTTKPEDYQRIMDSFEKGKKNINKICEENSQIADRTYIESHLTNVVNYNFGEKEKESLQELYRYAFFYGFTDYIPEFNFADIK